MAFRKLPPTSQPQQPVGVDLANPLSQGLFAAVNPAAGLQVTNLVGRSALSLGGGWLTNVKTKATVKGIAFSADGSSSGSTTFFTLPTNGTSTRSFTLVGVIYVRSTTGAGVGISARTGSDCLFLRNNAGSFSVRVGGTDYTGSAFQTNTWLSYVLTSRTDGVSLYVNGVRVLSGAAGGLGTMSNATVFADTAGGGTMDADLAFISFARTGVPDSVAQALSVNPWQLFEASQQPIVLPLVSGVTIYRPNSDIVVNSWVATPGGTLASCIDESVADDADFITSPNLTQPATLGLSASMAAGTYTVRVRAAYVGAMGQVRIRFLDSSNVDVGGSGWQTLTGTASTYSLSATLTGTADRFRIEVQ